MRINLVLIHCHYGAGHVLMIWFLLFLCCLRESGYLCSHQRKSLAQPARGTISCGCVSRRGHFCQKGGLPSSLVAFQSMGSRFVPMHSSGPYSSSIFSSFFLFWCVCVLSRVGSSIGGLYLRVMADCCQCRHI